MVKKQIKGIDTKIMVIVVVAIVVALVAFLFVGGYIRLAPPAFSSQKEASSAVTEIGSEVGDITSTLEEIEKTIG